MNLKKSLSRYVFDFTDIFEYIITAYFLWSFISTCGSLLMVQTELVKYCIVTFSFAFFILNMVCNAGTYWRLYQLDETIDYCNLVVFLDFFVLWIGWTCIQPIWGNRLCYLSKRMVWISHRSTANATDAFNGHPKAGCPTWIRESPLYSRIIKKGDRFYLTYDL